MLVMSPRWREMYGQGSQKGPEGFLQKNTVVAKAKLAVGEEWTTRTVETTCSAGDPSLYPWSCWLIHSVAAQGVRYLTKPHPASLPGCYADWRHPVWFPAPHTVHGIVQ